MPNIRDFHPADSQEFDVIHHESLLREIDQMRHLLRMIEDKDWTTQEQIDELNRRISSKIAEDDKLIRESIENKNCTAKHLMRCMVVSDIAVTFADGFADSLHKTSKGLYGHDNSYSKMIREASDKMEKVMRVIDGAKNDAVENKFAQVQEELQQKVIKLIDDFLVEKTKSDPQFARMFFK